MTASLNRQIRSLIARYGRDQVRGALANAEAAEASQQRAARAARVRPKNHPDGRTKRTRKSPLEVVEAARVAPEVRPVIERIALAYEAKEILPEPWRVKRFLESQGVDADRIRSRADALREVVGVLAPLPRAELEELFEGLRKHVEIGDLGMIAEAILGPRKSVASAGER